MDSLLGTGGKRGYGLSGMWKTESQSKQGSSPRATSFMASSCGCRVGAVRISQSPFCAFLSGSAPGSQNTD